MQHPPQQPQAEFQQWQQATLIHNTSGYGNASIIPPEIRGWNWGAFLLSWIWGIGNNTWITLIILMPIGIMQLVLPFVLGAKGNEWAWQNKKWDSIEHFKRTQKLWKYWGFLVLGLFIIILVLLLVLLVIQ